MNKDRFKFRVWDEAAGFYHKANSFAFADSGEPLRIGNHGTALCLQNPQGLVFEQCTGRKDKNGRLIYEGDIISGSNGSINGRYWTFKHEIKWDEKKGFSVPKWGANEDWSHWYEVVGNIHENPELLKHE